MTLFCSVCKNLMTISTTSDDFHYQCSKCMSHVQPTDRDTLVYENMTGTNFIIYKSILANAGQDPVNPKISCKCTCGNRFARQVRLGSEMKLINTCTACGDQWIDDSREIDEKKID